MTTQRHETPSHVDYSTAATTHRDPDPESAAIFAEYLQGNVAEDDADRAAVDAAHAESGPNVALEDVKADLGL